MKLEEFLTEASANEAATRTQLAKTLKFADEINDIFEELFSCFKVIELPELFVLRSRSSFLSAVRACLSGEFVPSFMILRGCLESSLYGYIAKDKENTRIWLDRHKNDSLERYTTNFDQPISKDAKRTKCSQTFKASVAIKEIRKEIPTLARQLENLYELSIDYGGHPNAYAVISGLKFDEAKGSANYYTLLSAGDDKFTENLFVCLEYGFAALFLLPHILPAYEEAFEAREKAIDLHDRKERWMDEYYGDLDAKVE